MKKQQKTTRQRTTGPAFGKASARRAVPADRRKGVTRSTFVRMKKIFGWLQDGLYPNCSTIARDLEVSVKTAARDVDCLRDEWELPIGYDDKRHGFYFTEKLDRLPWVPVSEAELFAVCISSKVLELYDGMPFQKPLELAFAKMTRSPGGPTILCARESADVLRDEARKVLAWQDIDEEAPDLKLDDTHFSQLAGSIKKARRDPLSPGQSGFA